jgi:hypothetical protein
MGGYPGREMSLVRLLALVRGLRRAGIARIPARRTRGPRRDPIASPRDARPREPTAK